MAVFFSKEAAIHRTCHKKNLKNSRIGFLLNKIVGWSSKGVIHKVRRLRGGKGGQAKSALARMGEEEVHL